jgi:hypothetical protein
MGTKSDANRFSGRPCGYSHIEMASEQEAHEAVEQLNRKVLEERALEVIRA